MTVATMLKGQELFESLPFEAVDRINRFSHIKELNAGETVFTVEKKTTHLYILLEGKIRLRLTARAHGASLVVGVFEKGDFFGLASLVGVDRHTTTAECAGPCRVLAIEAEPLRELLANEAFVGHRIMRVAARAYFLRYVEALRRIQRVVNDLATI